MEIFTRSRRSTFEEIQSCDNYHSTCDQQTPTHKNTSTNCLMLKLYRYSFNSSFINFSGTFVYYLLYKKPLYYFRLLFKNHTFATYISNQSTGMCIYNDNCGFIAVQCIAKMEIICVYLTKGRPFYKTKCLTGKKFKTHPEC